MKKTLQDELVRKQALDPEHSFIVQAPAGSGKTTLLVERYLTLLKHVKNPEEIIAITFTRKAANEMREKILCHLKIQENKIQHKGGDKSRFVSMINPQRLRILTIDALSRSIVSQLPYLSDFGGVPQTAEQSKTYYQQAVQNLFLNFKNNDLNSQNALENLLLHLDNRADHLEDLLIDLLSKREQWSSYLVPYRKSPHELRSVVESGLQQIARETLQTLTQCFPKELLEETLMLFNYASGEYVSEEDKLPSVPANHLENLSIWKTLAQFLLTKEGRFRKTVNKNHGFPIDDAFSKGMKKRMLTHLENLFSHIALEKALQQIIACPPIHYHEQQWKILESLIQVLPIVLANLRLIFSAENTVDFTEINLAALQALGDENAPTDLALYLDYQIKHILVDEFQDTSMLHFQLIEKLISGWQENDGRTLFLVGDPMQSIYRFRQAEVGLFLRTKTQGIGSIKLIPLTLKTNFRSEKNITDWVNQTFEKIFPMDEDIAMGAVAYSPVESVHENTRKISVFYHFFSEGEEYFSTERKIILLIKEYQQQNPENKIAVLVQSRSQLISLLPLLRKAKIDYQASELETLSENSVIIDLMSLLKSILNLNDRLSWLAVLRAPFCGLSLKDLWMIAQASQDNLVWLTLKQHEKLALSDDAHRRLKKILPLFDQAFEEIGGKTIHAVLKKLWLSLGGAVILKEKADASNVMNWFDLLMKTQDQIKLLEAAMENLFADAGNSDANVLIMTIHKAKGLEFDHVILPDLHRHFPNESKKLLQWLERPRLLEGNDLILAPIAGEADEEPVNEYLKNLEKEKLFFESQRLFYVASTRAKKTLDLLGYVEIKENEITPPFKKSFLGMLWEAFGKDQREKIKDKNENGSFFVGAIHESPEIHTDKSQSVPTVSSVIRRLPMEYFQTKNNLPPEKNFTQLYSLNFSEQMPRIIGIVLHKALQQIGKTGIEKWTWDKIKSQKNFYRRQLIQNGLEKIKFETALEVIFSALKNIFNDEQACWILSNRHQMIQNEYALSGFIEGKLLNIVIDRTFIDEKNQRWIIDYKTTLQDNKSELENYQMQLKKYADLMQQFDPTHSIKTALYFPQTLQWMEF